MPKVSPVQSQIVSNTDEIGKTSEAKTDMARLQEVRRRREAAAKQREAEAAGESSIHRSVIELTTAEAAREAAEKKEKASARKM
jgi:hypothetical protein